MITEDNGTVGGVVLRKENGKYRIRLNSSYDVLVDGLTYRFDEFNFPENALHGKEKSVGAKIRFKESSLYSYLSRESELSDDAAIVLFSKDELSRKVR